MKIRVLLVAEMAVRTSAPASGLNAKLDALREAVLPSDYGITLYQATAEDLMAFIGPLWMPIESDALLRRPHHVRVHFASCPESMSPSK